ncbi:MAG: cardiolipin synthase [bacterium]
MIEIIDAVLYFWPYLFSFLLFAINLMVTVHVILYKREVRAAIGWIGLTWFSLGVGAFLYYLFGINRIQRKARNLFEESGVTLKKKQPETMESPAAQLSPDYLQLKPIARLVKNLTRRSLTAGNRIEPLVNGDSAYPAMLEAIEEAKRSVTLSTYIFDRDRVGKKFMKALDEAFHRGVEVRVLIDDIGAKYSMPTVTRWFYERGIPCRRFMKSLLPWHIRYYNLRSHRKIMVVDGQIGFTGGINIRESSMHSLHPDFPISDLHFRLRGPVVAQLQRVFFEDWAFTCGEILDGESWFPRLKQEGEVCARGIADGPDEDYNRLEYILHSAISSAKKSVKITTPYFLPSRELLRALKVAALEGIVVEIILPRKNNLRMVQWASNSYFKGLLQRGVKIYLSPPPFDHSKLMIVDDRWILLGSSNWDARSLKLNFEFNVECYSYGLGDRLSGEFEKKKQASHCLSEEEVDSKSFLKHLRDNSFRLFSPYL